jgi:hypothetical protein
MPDEIKGGLEPQIIWGEHRTSEPLAMDIRQRLLKDDYISSRITFHEYEKTAVSDYTEKLFAQDRAAKEGKTLDQIRAMLSGFREEKRNYDHQLRHEFGPLVFNLHDGYKRDGVNYDIEFRLPDGIKDEDMLVEYLQQIAEQHNITLKITRAPKAGFIKPPESIIVEFMTPNADEISAFPSEEIERLAKQYDPMDAGGRDFIDYKIADRNHPSYLEAIDKYSKFMRDVVIGLEEVRIE